MLTKLHVFLLLLITPAAGFFLSFQHANPFEADHHQLLLPLAEVEAETRQLNKEISNTDQLLQRIQKGAEQNLQEMDLHHQKIEQLMAASQIQTKKSEDVLDQILTNLLGKPIGETYGKRATIKVFSLEESGYRGYMAKVDLHDPQALKMVLANDLIYSFGETTSHAANRKNAALAVNAGGFSKNGNGQVAPLGITVIDGIVRTFSSNQDLSFVGFNKEGRLIGGKISSKEEIAKMGVLQGASFLPTLLKDGKRVPIPKEWANKKHPRTLIGHFTNGDLLFIVIDGRRKGWSDGVTLEEAQSKLLEFKVRDAFNLDGGGSSAFYYKGRILNRPSDGKERPVSTNLLILP